MKRHLLWLCLGFALLLASSELSAQNFNAPTVPESSAPHSTAGQSSSHDEPAFLVWGNRVEPNSQGRSQIIVLKGTQVTEVTPRNQDWQLWSVHAGPRSDGWELTGVLGPANRQRVWTQTVIVAKDHKLHFAKVQVFPEIWPDIRAIEILPSHRAIVFDRGLGPELSVISKDYSQSWAWSRDVHLTCVALGPGQSVAVAGFQGKKPFLWKNGHEIFPPYGWRGLLTSLVWKSDQLEAVGRGAPSDRLPLVALWYDDGIWKTLDVPSAGNFPALVGVSRANKKSGAAEIEIAGCRALPPDGLLTPWHWQGGQMWKWKTTDQLVSWGPAVFQPSFATIGQFKKADGLTETRLWDGKQAVVLKDWPQTAVIRGLSVLSMATTATPKTVSTATATF